jgi:hypothetical protein
VAVWIAGLGRQSACLAVETGRDGGGNVSSIRHGLHSQGWSWVRLLFTSVRSGRVILCKAEAVCDFGLGWRVLEQLAGRLLRVEDRALPGLVRRGGRDLAHPVDAG